MFIHAMRHHLLMHFDVFRCWFSAQTVTLWLVRGARQCQLRTIFSSLVAPDAAKPQPNSEQFK